MFIVIETDHLKSTVVEADEVATGFIYDENKFIEFIQDSKSELGTQYLKGVTINDLRNGKYQDGHYLIDGTDTLISNELILINKHREIATGYFYTSTYIYTEELIRWKLIPFNGEQEKVKIKNKDINIQELEHTFLDYDLLDNKQINNDSLIGIIGKAGTGKTILIDSILRSLSQEYLKDSLVVTIPTKDNFYKSRHPSINVITRFDSAIIKEYLNKNNGCIVIDDILIPKKVRDSVWESIFYKSKKMRIITVQKGNDFQPKIRRIIDYIFYLKDDRDKEINKIWNYDGQTIIKDTDKFKNIFDQMTDNYGSMVFKRENNDVQMYRYNAIYKIKLE
jgi:uridine kinase